METIEKTRPTTDEEKQVFKFLNRLRDSGATNMYGASPYIESAFKFSKVKSRELLTSWMKNFDETGNYEKVKI